MGITIFSYSLLDPSAVVGKLTTPLVKCLLDLLLVITISDRSTRWPVNRHTSKWEAEDYCSGQ